jgi:hypothetical protein
MKPLEAEQQELERAIELLGKGTRHARLLAYLGAKYFQGQPEQLTEFNIATEVFGRSPQRFTAAEDAVARVEVHRLRKKLSEIYGADTRTQGLQISLPLGSYLPKFTPVPAPAPAPAPAADPGPDAPRRPRMRLVYATGIALAVVVIVAFLVTRRPPHVPPGAGASTAANVTPAASTTPSARVAQGALTEVHVMAGYNGSEVIDSAGVRWTPDRYYAAGGQWSRDSGRIRGTSRPFLFDHWRTGEFGYDFPMVPGNYELRLFFVSPYGAGEEFISTFSISLGGKPLLEAFDIAMSANGGAIAEEQVFRDVIPDEQGFVRLWFSNMAASPMVSALELTPGTAGKLKPIRILTQPTSFLDHKGQRWRADDYYLGGFQSEVRRKVTSTEDPELFGMERFGHFRYAIPVDRRGRYTVILHFAEMYYGPQLPGGGGVGRRIFHVFCNGQTLLRDFDIFKEAGSLRVVTKKFSNIKPSGFGKINIDFEPLINNATVSGIEILEE